MELSGRRYPIGIQNFEQLRTRNCVYVDKTELVYKLVNTDQIYFFSRPRRFGKSLLVSTLEAYFQGKKELFEGLAMERLEQEWEVCPVLHVDFSLTKYTELRDLTGQLNLFLSRWEEIYGKKEEEEGAAERLQGIILRAYAKTGKPVVVLIDEYDAPLLDSNSDALLQQQLRNEMRKFFSPLKGLGQYLRFLFITGISKFSQLSIFSELNNLQNISMRDDFSALCGITEEELLTQLKPDIERMAEANDETYEEACLHLKRQYDGYHFSKACADIYNPFSLFNAFNSKEYKNYWFSTGTPTFLIDILQESDFDIRELDNTTATAEQFDAPSNRITDPLPVLYQSGYLTIKGYDKEVSLYTLGFPNDEVRYGFLNFLIPYYTEVSDAETGFYIVKFMRELRSGNVDAFMERLKVFFAGMPYELSENTERHYQAIFYVVFTLMGQFVETEVRSARGRADAVVKTKDFIFVFEFKLNGTAEEALKQIDEKGYLIPYTLDGRKLVKVGVNFSKEKRNIDCYVIG